MLRASAPLSACADFFGDLSRDNLFLIMCLLKRQAMEQKLLYDFGAMTINSNCLQSRKIFNFTKPKLLIVSAGLGVC